MKTELQEILFKKYPEIFIGKDKPITDSLMPFGFECGDGWYGIIDTLCQLIQQYVQDRSDLAVEALQVKEKYGGLRFYINGGDDYVDGLISFAERLSTMTCEQCGSTEDVTQTKGWILTLCKKCLFERDMAQYGGEDD
jgi:hypothetical protein